MGGPAIDKRHIKSIISSQTTTFDYQSIAQLTGISTSSARNILIECDDEGLIYLDHREGRRKKYAVVGVELPKVEGANDPIIGEVVAPTPKVNANMSRLTPAERFEQTRMLVNLVADGISPSAMITGLSGIGKTFTVIDTLQSLGMKMDDDFIMVKGHSTPMGLYRSLYEHQEQMLVFDDCDGIFKDKVAIGLLKAALDSYNRRTVAWNSERLPDDLDSPFDFNGQIIFVSNLLAQQVDAAVKSRTMLVDLQMSRKELCEYIGTILPNIDEGLDILEMEEVLEELTLLCNSFESFNIRTFLNACRIYKGAKARGYDWKKSILMVL